MGRVNERAVMRQALEALETDTVPLNAINNAMALLRAALMEPVVVQEQEPNAKTFNDGVLEGTLRERQHWLEQQEQEQEQERVVWECKAGGLKPLSQRLYDLQPDNIKRHYTRIPRREWVSLTDADFDSICDNHSTLQGAARAIEAALKERNHG